MNWKLIYNQIGKDLQAQRWLVGLWVLMSCFVALADTASIERWLVGNYSHGYSIYYSLLGLLRFFVFFGAIASSVVMDPLVGNDQFWITRPTRGVDMLAAKFLNLFGLLIALPFGLKLCAFIAVDGVFYTAIREASIEAFFFFCILVPLMCLTAWFRNTKQMGRAAIIFIFLLILSTFSPSIFWFGDPFRNQYALLGLEYSRDIVFCSIYGFCSVIALYLQYRFRLLKYSIAVGLLGVGLGFLVDKAWNWNFYETWLPDTKRFVSNEAFLGGSNSGSINGERYSYVKIRSKMPLSREWSGASDEISVPVGVESVLKKDNKELGRYSNRITTKPIREHLLQQLGYVEVSDTDELEDIHVYQMNEKEWRAEMRGMRIEGFVYHKVYRKLPPLKLKEMPYVAFGNDDRYYGTELNYPSEASEFTLQTNTSKAPTFFSMVRDLDDFYVLTDRDSIYMSDSSFSARGSNKKHMRRRSMDFTLFQEAMKLASPVNEVSILKPRFEYVGTYKQPFTISLDELKENARWDPFENN